MYTYIYSHIFIYILYIYTYSYSYSCVYTHIISFLLGFRIRYFWLLPKIQKKNLWPHRRRPPRPNRHNAPPGRPKPPGRPLVTGVSHRFNPDKSWGKSSLALKTTSWAEFLRTIYRKLCVLPIKYRPFNRKKILKSRHWKMKWVRYPLVDTENNNETRKFYTTDHYINRAKALFIHINSLLDITLCACLAFKSQYSHISV